MRALGFLASVRSQLARAAAFEEAMIRLEAVLPSPPSREVFLEEYRRANLASSVEVTPLEVADRMIRDWALAP